MVRATVSVLLGVILAHRFAIEVALRGISLNSLKIKVRLALAHSQRGNTP